MIDSLLTELTLFALAIVVGYEVVSKAPALQHAPLLSGISAIHGIVLAGGILVLGMADTPLGMVLGFLAVFLGAGNVVGGFLATDRMLRTGVTEKEPK